MKSKNLVLNAIVCAIYVVLTLINPLSYLAIQFRFSEIMAVLPFFNRKFIPGVALGVLIANLFSPLGLIDVFIGLIICAITYTISYYLKNIFINSIIYSILCGIFVGGELYYVAHAPLIATGTSVLIGQIVVTFIGCFIFIAINKKINIGRI